jgi:hypothetical protein
VSIILIGEVAEFGHGPKKQAYALLKVKNEQNIKIAKEKNVVNMFFFIISPMNQNSLYFYYNSKNQTSKYQFLK